MTIIGGLLMFLTGFDLLDGKATTPRYVLFATGAVLLIAGRIIEAFEAKNRAETGNGADK